MLNEKLIKMLEEYMLDETFFVITMIAKTGQRLYLKSDGITKDWTFNKGDAIWFENYTDAEDFANKWFKHFKSWEIIEI